MRRRHTFYAVFIIVLYGCVFSSKAQALNTLTDSICAQSATSHEDFIACNNRWLDFYVGKLQEVNDPNTEEKEKKELCLDAAWSLLHIDPFWINYIETSSSYDNVNMTVYKNPEYFASTCSDVVHHYLYLKRKHVLSSPEKSLKHFSQEYYISSDEKNYVAVSLILEILYPFLIGKQGSFLMILDPNQAMKIIRKSTKNYLVVNKPSSHTTTRLTGPAKEFIEYIIPSTDWSSNNNTTYVSCKDASLSLNAKSTCSILKIRDKFSCFKRSIQKDFFDQKINFMTRPNMDRSLILKFKNKPFDMCQNKNKNKNKNNICSTGYESCSTGGSSQVCWKGQKIDITVNTVFNGYIYDNNHKKEEYKLRRTAHAMRGFANYQLNEQLVSP